MAIVDENSLYMLDEILQQQDSTMQVIYILSDSPVVRDFFESRSRIYPIHANIRSLLRHDIVDEIICCVSSLSEAYIADIKAICNQFGVSLLIPHDISFPGLPIKQSRIIGEFCFLILETSPRKRAIFILKTAIEKIFAASALIMLSPVMLFISILIKLTSNGPVIFKQQRVGLRGRKFYIFKFRTMSADAEILKDSLKALNECDGPAFKIRNDPRITPFGKILRKSGLDELPQLYNIVKGEMTLIGPRPMLPVEVYSQKEWQLKRMCIKPGITCTWQIQPNRNNVPFEQWMQLDRDYVENWSIGTDFKIFFQTVKSVFVARGL